MLRRHSPFITYLMKAVLHINYFIFPNKAMREKYKKKKNHLFGVKNLGNPDVFKGNTTHFWHFSLFQESKTIFWYYFMEMLLLWQWYSHLHLCETRRLKHLFFLMLHGTINFSKNETERWIKRPNERFWATKVRELLVFLWIWLDPFVSK